jgi:uncharacterized protein YdcH (DUF465 family)
MFAICATPVRVYNSVEKKPEAVPIHPRHVHRKQYAMKPRCRIVRDTAEIEKLQKQVMEYEASNKKLKKLAEWNLRSTKSALKDVQEILEIIEDLYGDQAIKD